MKRCLPLLLLCVILPACNSEQRLREEAQQFLDTYTKTYQKLFYESQKAEWAAQTYIKEGDTTRVHAAKMANEALATFTGSIENINKAKELLEEKDKLKPLQVKQLQKALYMAANNPQTVPEVVKKRIKAEADQTQKLYGFKYRLGENVLSTNDIDDILHSELNAENRLLAWNASKEVGKVLKDGLVELRQLRNETVKALDYPDYFTYQVSDYGMSREEMIEMLDQFMKELRPLYRELHTYARYELAARYGMDSTQIPDYLPAHWLPNRWGQDWSGMVNVQGLPLDDLLKQKSNEWLVKQAEQFYISLGFPPLPKSFYEQSSLYPVTDKSYSKNNHASAWHLDLDKDVRSLMSVVPNAEWYETVHHELGHIYYFLTYTNPDVPVLLREGANRAYHEAMGSLMGLAAMQKPFIRHIGLLPAEQPSADPAADSIARMEGINMMLKEALNYVVAIPWGAGTMTHFEHDLYVENIAPDEFNRRWWDHVKKYQGIVPPESRGEEYCDAATKTHVNDDPAQYYDYAISIILLFQLHDHIATKILKQDPHATDYFGNKDVGNFLRDIMYPGMSSDWRKLLMDKTGEELSAKAMVKYFEPLMEYLKEVNKGRKYTLENL